MKIRVTWTTQETVEWEAEIDVPDDFDVEGLNGDSRELVDRESPDGGELQSFYREVQTREVVAQ